MTMFKKLAFVGVAALAMTSAPAAAQYVAPSADGKATVNLYDAIEIEKVADVDFGTLIRDAGTAYASASVSLDNNDAVTCAANMSCTGTTTTGVFELKGDSGSEMQVSLGGADYDANGGENGVDVTLAENGQLTLVNTGDASKTLTMDVEFSGMNQDRETLYNVAGDSTSGVAGYSNLNTFSVTGTGAREEIRVYGSLFVPDSTNAPNGVYEASFTLTADYK